MALTPRQIIEMSKRGVHTPTIAGTYEYEGDPNEVVIDMSMRSFNYMDPIEKIEYARNQVNKYKEKIKNTDQIIKQVQKEQEEIKIKNAQSAKSEEETPPE